MMLIFRIVFLSPVPAKGYYKHCFPEFQGVPTCFFMRRKQVCIETFQVRSISRIFLNSDIVKARDAVD